MKLKQQMMKQGKASVASRSLPCLNRNNSIGPKTAPAKWGTPILAFAEDADLSATAVTEIGKLKPMVAAVGGAFLGVALAFVGYRVIMKVINRGG